jgi:hypothetical protein
MPRSSMRYATSSIGTSSDTRPFNDGAAAATAGNGGGSRAQRLQMAVLHCWAGCDNSPLDNGVALVSSVTVENMGPKVPRAMGSMIRNTDRDIDFFVNQA